MERADAAIVACDSEGALVLSNAAARELFGSKKPSVDDPLMDALIKSASSGVEVVLNAPAVTGVAVLVSAQPLFDKRGNRMGAVATCAPLAGVVEGQRSEAEESRKRLELLLESTGEGIYGIDTKGECTFVNGSAAAMLGHRREALIGQQMHDIMHHTDASGSPYPVEECPIYRAFRDGRGCRIDDELFFRADGSSFPAEYSSYPILDEGRVRGAVITFNDITSRKHTEAALRKSEAKYLSLLCRSGRSKRFTAILELDRILADVELQLRRKDGRVIKLIENSRAIRDERKRLIYYEGTLSLAR